MAMIYEHKPNGSYKRIITLAEAKAIHNRSGSEYTFEEITDMARKHDGAPTFASELDQEPNGTLYATSI